MTGDAHLPAGAVLDLAEADYLYGRDRLRLRLVAPLDTRRLATLEWVRLVGEEIWWNGEIRPRRDVMVRVAAIKAAVRPVGWLPQSAHDYEASRLPKRPTGPCEY